MFSFNSKIKVNYLDLSVAILIAFINPQKYKKTILSVAFGAHVIDGGLWWCSEGIHKGHNRTDVPFCGQAKEASVLWYPNPLGSSSDGKMWWIEAGGYILLLLSKGCNFQNRYLKKCKLQCIFQAARLHHWIFWLCYCLEAISQLHSHCKLACLIMV